MRGEAILQTPTGWLRFRDPIEIVEARRLDAVLPALRALEAAVNAQRCYAAGCIAYEAAPAFDPALRVKAAAPTAPPLLWFGLYAHAEPIERPPLPPSSATLIDGWTPTVDWPDYERAIHAIKDHIAAGHTYQVNYTYRLRAAFDADAREFFLQLAQRQFNGYAAYLDLGSHVICSASPELFFYLDGDLVTARPMKGTAPRGRTLAEDRAHRAWLHHSEKNRAENVMIVDMIRNDLGRIARIGSVDVPALFTVERYPTVLQMTSTVTARTTASFVEIMAALFPCASITGAPKVRTMQIIAGLETTPRGVYTGAIGYLAPDRIAQFNVAIRTVTIERATGQAEYGVGGGIVWDSDAADEWRECEIKTRVLTAARPNFDLIESILWTPAAGYWLLERHLSRLTDSAEYFCIPIDPAQLSGRLRGLASSLPPVDHKVRVTVSRSGAIDLSAVPLADLPLPQPLRLGLAREPVDERDPFLYHKTTQRSIYDAARAARPDCDDVILYNRRGEITESTIANVVVELDGGRYTPPVESGLLPGTLRAELLERGDIRERVIRADELRAASRVWLINSVRGWREGQLAMSHDDERPINQPSNQSTNR